MKDYFNQITEPLLMQSYATLFFVSFILCLIIIVSSGYGFSRRGESDETAVQSAHSGFVPRVGGLAIYLSILVLIPLLSFGFIPLSVVFDLDAEQMTLLILSAAPVFSVGLAEDLGYDMTPKARLIASAFSSLIAILLFKVWLESLGILGVDTLLMFAPFGILFTIFATVGVVNAFNLIDGLNGLSSYVTVSVAGSLSIIAFKSGNTQISIFLILCVAAVLGFMALNFPLGKIFLGDGGAYVLGHLLVWSAIILINDAAEVSAFAILLVFFWPVADTGLAIWRRWKLGNPTDRPDRLHFHQLAMRFLEIRFFGRDRREIANPVATLILIPLITAPQVLGVLFWDDFRASVMSTAGMGLLFLITYLAGIAVAKRGRITSA
ncbi:MAG: MraY family glycosyltransferase [Pseudomonadota bacterium]|nr:MraY family glycosyltransferase [Pseudomonadota bacterium]